MRFIIFLITLGFIQTSIAKEDVNGFNKEELIVEFAIEIERTRNDLMAELQQQAFTHTDIDQRLRLFDQYTKETLQMLNRMGSEEIFSAIKQQSQLLFLEDSNIDNRLDTDSIKIKRRKRGLKCVFNPDYLGAGTRMAIAEEDWDSYAAKDVPYIVFGFLITGVFDVLTSPLTTLTGFTNKKQDCYSK